MAKRAFTELDQAIRAAAGAAYGCDPGEIFVEIEDQHLTKDGRPSIIVNWSQSMKADTDARASVKQAISDALPEPYKRYHVQLV